MSERTQITTPAPLEEDQQSEPSLRPQRLSEFIGQAKVREALSIAIEAARTPVPYWTAAASLMLAAVRANSPSRRLGSGGSLSTTFSSTGLRVWERPPSPPSSPARWG